MAILNSAPMRFSPRGLSDAFDATDKFPGACQALTNLVHDPSNPELVVSRPGVTPFVDFRAGWAVIFFDPSFISLQVTVGQRVYGMIATSLNPGHDQPFCYDNSTGNFIVITGITGANTPTSPATSGEWTPPTLTVVGTMVIVTHPGFDGVTHFFGWIDITNPAAPVWHSGNTVTTVLPAIPSAVANFNNRAYFAVANRVYYTDVLTNPPTITNATQFLVIGDSSNVNALAGLPVQTTSSGVVGALIVWKPTSLWQITGDTTTSDLALNFISTNIGTNMPRSIAQAPFGIYFGSTGGPYFIDLLGTLRLVTHQSNVLEPDIITPFVAAQDPTRWAGAYVTSTYRVCGKTIIGGIQQISDYWFYEPRRRWSGPHSFSYDCGSSLNGFFLLSTANSPAILIKSETQQTIAFTNADLGVTLQCDLLSATFPKVGDMLMKQVAESQIELSASGGDVAYHLTARDDQGMVLGTATIGVVQPIPRWDEPGLFWDDGVTLWYQSNRWGGGGLWGPPENRWGQNGNWGDTSGWWVGITGSGLRWGAGKRAPPHTYPVPWPAPLVFEKMELEVEATASASLAIGTFYARYQKTGWLTMGPPIS